MDSNVKNDLISIKEGLCELPICDIPALVGDVFYKYEKYVRSNDFDNDKETLLLKLEYLRDDLESNHKLSINDIRVKLIELINEM